MTPADLDRIKAAALANKSVRCEICGRSRDDHEVRHMFKAVVPAAPSLDDVLALVAEVERLRAAMSAACALIDNRERFVMMGPMSVAQVSLILHDALDKQVTP